MGEWRECEFFFDVKCVRAHKYENADVCIYVFTTSLRLGRRLLLRCNVDNKTMLSCLFSDTLMCVYRGTYSASGV